MNQINPQAENVFGESSAGKINRLLSFVGWRIFRPLATIFLRHNVPFKTAATWLKQAYVDVASNKPEFSIDGKKQTKSRIAVITGLTRVEVDRILKLKEPLKATEQKWNRATRVLSGWASDPEFVNDQEQPLEIPVKGEKSFATLVERYSGGTTLNSVLDEAVQAGAVERLDNGQLRLLRPDLFGRADKKLLSDLEVIGITAGDLLNTIEHDTQPNQEDIWLLRLIIQRDVPEENLVSLKQLIHEETGRFLHDLDKKLTRSVKEYQSQSADEDDWQPKIKRVGLGAYYYQDNEEWSES